MKKILFNILLLVTCLCNNDVTAQTPQWSNWSKFPSCFLGFEFRVKSIGFNKYVNKYEWIAEVKNNYPVKVTFGMNWKVGSEKQSIGSFTVQQGKVTNAVSYYFASSEESCYVEIEGICFGEAEWCKCKADCDVRPGVPNQMSEEACNGLTSTPKKNSNSSSSAINSTRTTTNTYSTNNQPISSPKRDFKKFPIDAEECRELNPNGHDSEQCIWLNCPCPGCYESKNKGSVARTQTSVSQSVLNQYNEAQVQNTINNIQNTPVRTFEVGKLEIKNVKRQPASGLPKGSVSGIEGLEKIEIDFPEFSNEIESKCVELAQFRDNQLLNIYDEAFRKYLISQNGFDIVIGAKKELADDTKWETSDLGHATAVLSQFVQTKCNLLMNLIEFNPVWKTGHRTMIVIYDVIKNIKDWRKILTGDAISVGINKYLKEFGPVGNAIKTVKDLSTDIGKIQKNENEFKALREEVRIAFGNIEQELYKYNIRMKNSIEKIDEINIVINAIDTYISDNCKPSPNKSIKLN